MIRLGVNEIEGRIKDEANAECDKIVREADAKASELISEVREEIEDRKKALLWLRKREVWRRKSGWLEPRD